MENDKKEVASESKIVLHVAPQNNYLSKARNVFGDWFLVDFDNINQ